MIENVPTVLAAIGSFLGGSAFNALINARNTRDKGKIENESARVELEQKSVTMWQKLYQEMSNKYDKKCELMSTLYIEINNLRTELVEAKAAQKEAKIFECRVITCMVRKPPMGEGVIVKKINTEDTKK